MEFPYNKIVTTESGTVILAHDFAKEISGGDIIILNGNLGAGKTFFIKHVLEEFGISNVNSPTFAIVNEYQPLKQCGEKSITKFYHFDFYRINKTAELFDIGFNDYLNDEEAVTFIEWGELFEEILPHKRIEIKIKMNEDFSRDFIFDRQ